MTDNTMSKFTAVFDKTVQTSPDTWEVRTKTLQINEDTTIAELKEWFNKVHNTSAGKMYIKINEE